MDLEKLNIRLNKRESYLMLAPYLQDAIVQKDLIHYDAEKKLFSLRINRFCWEHVCKEECVRINAHFDIYHVTRAQKFGIDELNMLNLLTMHVDENTLYLLFSNHGMIKLELESFCAHLWDDSVHWDTSIYPCH